MPTPNKTKESTQPEHQDVQRVAAEISKHVMLTLGQPQNLYSVQVRPLWEDRYRVNVFVGADVVTARVAHSYFLTLDSDGKVVASNPRITKQY